VFFISQKTRINDQIRAKEVMVIGDDGEQLGVMSLSAALDLAAEKKLDLVEVAPNANPIVCKIMDYGKFKYDKEKKAKEAKKNQKVVVVKEIKFKSRIDKHDFDTKVAKISKFLEKEYKVKVSLMLFGRERMHSEIGINLLEQVAEIFADKAIIDKKYNEAQKFLMLSPKKQ
jgi:translation initiation factor IF-3